jgi:hypothetical protein
LSSRQAKKHFQQTFSRAVALSQGSFAFPITAITGSPESPVLAFWGGITRDSGDSGDLFLIRGNQCYQR